MASTDVSAWPPPSKKYSSEVVSLLSALIDLMPGPNHAHVGAPSCGVASISQTCW